MTRRWVHMTTQLQTDTDNFEELKRGTAVTRGVCRYSMHRVEMLSWMHGGETASTIGVVCNSRCGG
jgi:hypothetical protein